MLKNIWVSDADIRTIAPIGTQDWLMRPQVISTAFQLHSHDKVYVRVLEERRTMPLSDEIAYLKAHDAKLGLPWVRQVYLCSGAQPWSFARVVVPETTYLKHQQAFDTLGDKFLGENLLYGRPNVRRDPFEYIGIDRQSPWFILAGQGMAHPLTETLLWGRRSLFWIGEDPLLVGELFFDTLPQYCL